jgi:Pyruvate/2-oxoacid:ferredoxin oxidoreductase delta subunit/CheY-like chemotaxis protein
MKTLTCMIVDDEPLAVKMLEDFVSRTPYLRLAASFNDPVLALSTLRESSVDVLFLDIQMPDLDGLNLSRMVPPGTRVIFTTAFKEYAFDSYEVNALDFLLLGCTNLQICTAVMQYGFRIIDDLCEGLRLFMQENGYKTLSDLIGIALPNIVPPEKLERTQIHRPTVDNSLCLGCGRCFVSCNDGGHQAIRFTSMRKPVIDEQKCVGCHLCALVCPTFAIH